MRPLAAIPAEILEESTALFDDVRAETLDAEAHAAFIIARVLDRGTLRSVAALIRAYGLERIRDFLREGGAYQVSRRTLALWKAFLDLTEEECISTSSPRLRSPFWTD
jgi:undecaprenyl pyrophosphate synthase